MAAFLDKMERMRERLDHPSFTTDVIVGFPGETDADFEATMDIVRKTNYAQCYSFKYSMRPGTPGAEMDNQVDEDVKNDRLARLQALLNEQQQAFNKSCVGKTMEVLLEKPGRNDQQLIGRSPWL